MSFIVPEEIEAYAEAHTTPPDELLAELAEETKATLDSPQMLTGTIEGRLLEQLVHALQAKRVLELGTFSGYSSLSMAAGLPEGGHIDTCEVSQQHAEVARRYIARSPYADRITIHIGPALETIERLGASGTSSSSTPTRRTTPTTTRRCCRGSRDRADGDRQHALERRCSTRRRRGDDARDSGAERPARRRRAASRSSS